MVNQVVTARQAELSDVCQRFDVLWLDVFGSATTSRFDPTTSDLDFIVTFADEAIGSLADRYFDLAEALELLFGCPVDLLTERSIRNPVFRQAVDRSRQRVYERHVAQAPA